MDQLNGKMEQVLMAFNSMDWSFNGNSVDRSDAGNTFKVVATLSCGIFAGAALYATVVECPARMTHDSETAVKIWKPSFLKARSLMSKLVVISTGSSVAAFWCSNQRRLNEWLLAGGLMFSLLPLTVLTMLPINNELMETEKCIDNGNVFIVDKLNAWSNRLAVKTVVSVGAFGFMIYLLNGNK